MQELTSEQLKILPEYVTMWWDVEFCLSAVRRSARNLQYTRVQTEEMCLLAVGKNYRTLAFVRVQTQAIIITALNYNISSVVYVDFTKLDPETTEWALSLLIVVKGIGKWK